MEAQAIQVLGLLVIGLSLAFTFTNGLQDGSSVTASVIITRVLSPPRAVLLVATCELLGALLGGSAVAQVVRSITSWPARPDLLPVLAAGLTAAIVWNFLTKALHLPSSSTHALFGGLLGALVAASGTKYLVFGSFDILHASGIGKVVVSLFLSPLLGFIFGYLVLAVVILLLKRASCRVLGVLKIGQCALVTMLAFGHGSNDPQKTMGIILLSLHAMGAYSGEEIPFWVRLSTGLAIALGVASLAPGIVKRVGYGIYKMRVLHGFVAELASGSVVLASSISGAPVSTSQVISSAVMGVGSNARFKEVHWLVARDILVSWLLTIPGAGFFAGLTYFALFQWVQPLIDLR